VAPVGWSNEVWVRQTGLDYYEGVGLVLSVVLFFAGIDRFGLASRLA
jgi:hypothetical protein